MKKITIGIVDYSVGNLASVHHSLFSIGFRCRVSRDKQVLQSSDLILLPGVGAFPQAMEKLYQHELTDFIKEQANKGKPLLGICLGMQLLAESSDELESTKGLGIIPGNVSAIEKSKWHIGWNSINITKDDSLLKGYDGSSLYFNHSYVYQVEPQFQAATSILEGINKPLTAVVRKENIAGLQFHPEKSQLSGKRLLFDVIQGLCNA